MLLAAWHVLLTLSPWLLLGMAVAGVLHVALPPGFVKRHLTGRGDVFKAVLFGVPMPLCSCGVIPAGVGLKKDGASSGAALGFLISTPQTGLDSIFVSAAFLGWPFALFKVAAATVTGLAGGLWANAGSAVAPRSALPPQARRTWKQGLKFSIQVLRSIWTWIVFGVVVSAAIEVWLPPGVFNDFALTRGPLALVTVLLLALPLYVCATASVPIAASLVAAGLPPGAALVFLLAGPASNVATMGAIRATFGTRVLGIYLLTVGGGSILFGWLFDGVLTMAPMVGHHHMHFDWIDYASAAVVLGLLVYFVIERIQKRLRRA